MDKRCILILFFFLASYTVWSQQRHALLVAISEYPTESGWNKIHATNDLQQVRLALNKLGGGFIVTEVRDAEATHDGITKALESLIHRVRKGDYCFVLFSCHGQQITDLNLDESERDVADQYDEAIVPYDANIAYGWHGYKGEKHLRDDELNILFHELIQAIGPKGQLIVLYDACHSGDMSRAKLDEEEPNSSPRRGTADAFRIPSGKGLQSSGSSWPIEWISISACNSEHNNYEVMIDGKWYGRLAYSFCQVFREGMTGDELVKALQDQYKLLPTDSNRPVQVLDSFVPEKMKTMRLLK